MTHEIYFKDLNEQAQNDYLKFMGVETEEELNADVSPLIVLERD